MGETAAPSYDDVRKGRSESPSGGTFLRAKDYPNGLDVKVTGTEVRPGYQGEGFDPYWVVEADSKSGVYVKETKPMSDKLEELGITNPVGRSFILTQVTIQGNKTFQIARAL